MDITAKGIIFDFNGTLSADEAILEQSYEDALQAMCLPSLRDGEYEGLLGLSDPDIAAALLRSRSSAQSSEELLAHVSRSYLEACKRESSISDHTIATLRALHDHQIPMAIVTGTLRGLITPVLKEHGIFELFSSVITIEDVTHGKPHPEGFKRAASLMGIEPSELLVLEDSQAGVDAAISAGMTPLAVHGITTATLHVNSMDEAASLLYRHFAQGELA